MIKRWTASCVIAAVAFAIVATVGQGTEPPDPRVQEWRDRAQRTLAEVATASAHLRERGDLAGAALLMVRRKELAAALGGSEVVQGSRPEVHVVQLFGSPNLNKTTMQISGDDSDAWKADLPVSVHLTYTGAPIILVICADAGNQVLLRQDAGVRVQSLIRDNANTVTGLLPGVQTLELPKGIRGGPHGTACELAGYDGRPEFPRTGRLAHAIKYLTHLPIATHSTGRELGGEIVVGPESEAWRLQHVLHRFDDLIARARAINLRTSNARRWSSSAKTSVIVAATPQRRAGVGGAIVEGEDPSGAADASYRIEATGVWRTSPGTSDVLIAPLPARTDARPTAATLDAKRNRLIASTSEARAGLLTLDLATGTWGRVDKGTVDDTTIKAAAGALAGQEDAGDRLRELLTAQRLDVVQMLDTRVHDEIGTWSIGGLSYDEAADAVVVLCVDPQGSARALASVRAAAIQSDPAARGADEDDPVKIVELWDEIPSAGRGWRLEERAESVLLVRAAGATGTAEPDDVVHAIDARSGRTLATWAEQLDTRGGGHDPSAPRESRCPDPDGYASLALGWQAGWVALAPDPARGTWRRWPSEERGLGPYVTARGARALAVLDPARSYAGSIFTDCAWHQVWGAPLVADAPPGLVGIVGDRVVVYESRSHRALVLDAKGSGWRSVAELSPLSERQRCCPHVDLGGRLLVWGGEVPGYASPEAPQGQPLDATHPRSCAPVVARDKDGRSWIGKSQPGLKDGAILDLATERWTTIRDAPIAYRFGMAWTAWRNRLVVLGAARSDPGWIYDPADETWRDIARLPFDIGCRAAATVVGDTLFVVLGSTDSFAWEGTRVAALELPAGKWHELPPVPLSPRVDSLARAFDGSLLVWGGVDAASDVGMSDGAILDPATSAWSQLPTSPAGLPIERWAGESPLQRLVESFPRKTIEAANLGPFDFPMVTAEDF